MRIKRVGSIFVCHLLFTATWLVGVYRAPAAITHYVGQSVELGLGLVDRSWYLDGAAETIELGRLSALGEGVPPDNLVFLVVAYFPGSFDQKLRFIASGNNPMQVARLSAGTMFDASAPLVQFDRGYLPIFRQFDPIITFADGMWGNFEADAAASGYFVFRFDLNADGDPATDHFQYGWARITFSAVAETTVADNQFFMIIHEWGWGDIGDTDFRIGEQPLPSLSIARGSAGGVDLFWSGTSTVYQLQHADDLITTNWMNTPEQPVLDGITNTVNTPASADFRFYRLTE